MHAKQNKSESLKRQNTTQMSIHMYKYFKIRLRIHTKHRIKFYLSLLCCMACMLFRCWGWRLSFATATFATVVAITIHTRFLFCFVADRLSTYNSLLVLKYFVVVSFFLYFLSRTKTAPLQYNFVRFARLYTR